MLVDGVVVGTFTPSGTSYQSLSTAAFNVTAGSHTITFQGLNSAGGDNTAFVDQIAATLVKQIARSPIDGIRGLCRWVRASSSTGRPAPPGLSLAPPASRLTIAASPRATRRPPRVRRSPSSKGPARSAKSVSNWAAGTYVLTFNAAQRGNNQASRQDFRVLVDGVVVGTFTPSGTSYQSFSTAAFNITAGSHTITFQGLNSAGGDNTAFIDAVASASLQPRSPTKASSKCWWVPAVPVPPDRLPLDLLWRRRHRG